MTSVLYVYAVTREAATPDAEGVDGTTRFGTTEADGVHAVFIVFKCETEFFYLTLFYWRSG